MSLFSRILRPLSWAVFLMLAAALAEAPLRLAFYSAELAAMPAPASLAMPVEGVRPASLRDSWHAPRDGGGRRHEGLDIFAPRGRPVRSATEGIVLRVGTNPLGGQVVWVMGPGRQRHYYAHLDRYAGVRAGQRVQAGTVLGYVGTTGNARGTPPHLHYGIYTERGPVSPYPMLTRMAPASAQAGG